MTKIDWWHDTHFTESYSRYEVITIFGWRIKYRSSDTTVSLDAFSESAPLRFQIKLFRVVVDLLEIVRNELV